MWFGNKSHTDVKVTHKKTLSTRKDREMDYFKAQLSKPIPPATNGVESFSAKKKR